MRKLVLIRGPQGSGKSTLIRQMGLDPYWLSMDRVREILSGPVLSAADGSLTINNDLNDQVARLYHQLVDERMGRGELLVLEQALMMTPDILAHLERAKTHRYQVMLVDLSTLDLETIQARNAARPELLRVPAHVVAKSADRLLSSRRGREWPADLACLDASEHLADDIAGWLHQSVEEFTHRYRAIVHIGDLQGCHTVLTGPKGPLAQGLDPSVLYVFVGDLLDRGIENGTLMRWYLDHALGQPNVRLMFGNHEVHIDRWAKGMPPVSEEFAKHTLPQLKRAGITAEDAARLIASTEDLLAYRFHGHQVLVTHAGLPTVPPHLERLAAYQAIKGTGHWSDPVDQRFDQHAPAGWVQVHGHRNQGSQPIQASARSFNLEDRVEFGGSLRTATLSAEGWTVNSYANPVYAPYRERDIHPDRRTLEPEWMSRPEATRIPAELLATMRAHEGVRETVSKSHPHISSLNFTRGVFYDQAWDDIVVKARGLFFNNQTGEIVARAYDKFFNLDERPETQLDHVLGHAAFPIRAYRKDNGFLGLIGYDRQNDALFFSSKSTPDSDFAGWLKEIYAQSTTSAQREEMLRYLRDLEACVAVEVIDPVRDPHLVDYEVARLTVLDVFHRSSNLERLPFEKLAKFAQTMGLESKTEEMVFRNPDALAGWYARTQHDLTYRKGGQDLEGFVLEDANASMVKIKLPHYSFWKTLRGAKDRLARLRVEADKAAEQAAAKAAHWANYRAQAGLAIEASPSPVARMANDPAVEALVTRYQHPQAEAFLRWTLTVPTAELAQASILDLRRQFKASPAYDLAHEQVPWVPSYNREASPPAPTPPVAAPGRRRRGP